LRELGERGFDSERLRLRAKSVSPFADCWLTPQLRGACTHVTMTRKGDPASLRLFGVWRTFLIERRKAITVTELVDEYIEKWA